MNDRHSTTIMRNALLDEASRLEELIPSSATAKRNIANIKSRSPIANMGIVDLSSWVDLLKRSAPDYG